MQRDQTASTFALFIQLHFFSSIKQIEFYFSLTNKNRAEVEEASENGCSLECLAFRD